MGTMSEMSAPAGQFAEINHGGSIALKLQNSGSVAVRIFEYSGDSAQVDTRFGAGRHMTGFVIQPGEVMQFDDVASNRLHVRSVSDLEPGRLMIWATAAAAIPNLT